MGSVGYQRRTLHYLFNSHATAASFGAFLEASSGLKVFTLHQRFVQSFFSLHKRSLKKTWLNVYPALPDTLRTWC